VKIPQMLVHLYGIFCYKALTKALAFDGLKSKKSLSATLMGFFFAEREGFVTFSGGQ
jgi:hypothetical protein